MPAADCRGRHPASACHRRHTGRVLSLRISVPEGLTDDVVALLTGATSVTGLSVLRGASVIPPGDVVTADVAREGANPVLDALRDLGVHREGTVRIDPVDTWLSHPAFEAEREAPGASADAVVWTQVGNRAYADSELNWTYLSFMVLATLIAGVAIIVDSSILVIGAMVLGPEFGPIAAIGVALVRRRTHLLAIATRTLVLGFAAGILATFLAGLLGRALGWVTYADVVGPRPRDLVHLPPEPVDPRRGRDRGGRRGAVADVVAHRRPLRACSSPSRRCRLRATSPSPWRSGRGTRCGAAGCSWSSTWWPWRPAGWATLALQQRVWSRVPARRRTRFGGRSMIGRPPD